MAEQVEPRVTSCNLDLEHFTNLLQGNKRVEGRVNRDKFALIKEGEILEVLVPLLWAG